MGNRRRKTHFDRKVSSVHVISQEEIPSVGRVAADFKQLHQVELSGVKGENRKRGSGFVQSGKRKEIRATYVLTMNISADCNVMGIEQSVEGDQAKRTGKTDR